MKPPYEFGTERLHLRPPQIEDAALIFESYAQDPDVTKYLVWQPHKSVNETKSFLNRCVSVWAEGSAYPWVLTRNEDGKLIGMVEVRIDRYKADLGYVLTKTEWGKGYITEAVRAIVAWGLSQEEIYRVWAVCDVENRASARVLEKVGMRKEGVLRRWIIHPNISNEPRDCYSYARAK